MPQAGTKSESENQTDFRVVFLINWLLLFLKFLVNNLFVLTKLHYLKKICNFFKNIFYLCICKPDSRTNTD